MYYYVVSLQVSVWPESYDSKAAYGVRKYTEEWKAEEWDVERNPKTIFRHLTPIVGEVVMDPENASYPIYGSVLVEVEKRYDEIGAFNKGKPLLLAALKDRANILYYRNRD